MNENLILLILFCIGAMIGIIIMAVVIKNARKKFDETIKEDEKEWENNDKNEK